MTMTLPSTVDSLSSRGGRWGHCYFYWDTPREPLRERDDHDVTIFLPANRSKNLHFKIKQKSFQQLFQKDKVHDSHHIVSIAPYKRAQHCWPTAPNNVGCYILRLFTHPVACCGELLRQVWNRSNFLAPSVQTDATLLGVVASVCT